MGVPGADQLLQKEVFDLLLLDIKMPEMDGIDFLRQARSISPETEVIMVTGYATIETAVEAVKLGATDYFQKPEGQCEGRPSLSGGRSSPICGG